MDQSVSQFWGGLPTSQAGVLVVSLRCCLGPEWVVDEKWFRGERTGLAGSETQREPSHFCQIRCQGLCLCLQPETGARLLLGR